MRYLAKRRRRPSRANRRRIWRLLVKLLIKLGVLIVRLLEFFGRSP